MNPKIPSLIILAAFLVNSCTGKNKTQLTGNSSQPVRNAVPMAISPTDIK
jgi:hypothetical protein